MNCANSNCERIDMSLAELMQWNRNQRNEAEHLERERIIAMLEKRKCPCSTMVCIPVCPHTLTIDEIIRLIKEEK